MKKTAFYENKPQKGYSSLEYSRLEGGYGSKNVPLWCAKADFSTLSSLY